MDELPGQTKPNKELSYVLSFLQNRFDRLAAIPVCPENESQLREEIHLLLTLSHLCAASADQTQKQNLAHLTQGCHNILRKLENLMLCHAHVFPFESCAFVSFLDDICCACDLLLSGCGKRVLFDADLHLQAFSYDPGHSGLLPNGYDKCALFHIGTPEALVACAPGPVRTALLNLIANAALHSQSSTILVRLSCTPSHMLVTVRSAGETSLYALQRGTDTAGSGLCAVRRCAELHKGTLFFQSDEYGTAAAFALPRDLEAPEEAYPLPQPDFVEYICDRMSPVYTGLCGLCPCPV